MSVLELTQHAQFVIDREGNKKAVMLDLTVWEEIVALLADLANQDEVPGDEEDRIDEQLAESSLLQQRIAEARAHYQAGERGAYEALRRELLAHVNATESVICCSDDVLGGTPVFCGTRVPIKNLMDYLEAGDTLNEFLEDFPSVSREQAVRVLELAKEALVAQTYARAIG